MCFACVDWHHGHTAAMYAACGMRLSSPSLRVNFTQMARSFVNIRFKNSQRPTEPCHLIVSRLQRVVTHHRSFPCLDMLPSVMAAHMRFSPCTRLCGCGCAPIAPKLSYHLIWSQGWPWLSCRQPPRDILRGVGRPAWAVAIEACENHEVGAMVGGGRRPGDL
jgi:hypothetical protein